MGQECHYVRRRTTDFTHWRSAALGKDHRPSRSPDQAWDMLAPTPMKAPVAFLAVVAFLFGCGGSGSNATGGKGGGGGSSTGGAGGRGGLTGTGGTSTGGSGGRGGVTGSGGRGGVTGSGGAAGSGGAQTGGAGGAGGISSPFACIRAGGSCTGDCTSPCPFDSHRVEMVCGPSSESNAVCGGGHCCLPGGSGGVSGSGGNGSGTGGRAASGGATGTGGAPIPDGGAGGGSGEGAACSGKVVMECAAGLVCDFDVPGRCGASTAGGHCTTVPVSCDTTGPSVCGCDGRTYATDCERRRSRAQLDRAGACAAPDGGAQRVVCGAVTCAQAELCVHYCTCAIPGCQNPPPSCAASVPASCVSPTIANGQVDCLCPP